MKKNIFASKTLRHSLYLFAGLFTLLSTAHNTFALEEFTAQTIGGAGSDIAQSIIQTTDGGYAVAGYTDSYGAGNEDFYITKFTASGALDTSFGTGGTRTIGGSGDDFARSIIQTTDGGYAVAGYTVSYGAGGADVYITKLDSSGTLDTSFGTNGIRTVGGSGGDYAESIIQTTDGGYAVAGYTANYGVAGLDYYIIKLDSSGTLDTSFGTNGTRTIGGSSHEYAYAIIQTTDGGYAVAGRTESYGAGGADVYITKFTATGTLDTSFGSGGTRTIGGTGGDYARSIIQTPDDGYAVVGYTDSYGAGGLDYYIIKLDSSGALDTSFGTNGTRTVGGSSTDIALSIIQTTDGGYAVAGYTQSYGAGGADVYITKLDSSGALDTDFGTNGTRTVGGSSNDIAYSIIQTTDGGYAVAGYTTSYGVGSNDVYITKLSATGDMGDCSHNSGGGGEISSGGTLGNGGGTLNSGGILSSGDSISSGGTLTQQCIIQTLTDTTIQNPGPTKIQDAVTNGYVTLDNGTIDNTTSTTTQVNVTFTQNGKEVTFPTNTTITEQTSGNFNFQNFTLEEQDITNQQPDSRKAFRLGIEGTNLNFSQDITVTTYIGTAFNNQTLDILYQNEGESTWNTQGTCTVTNGNCTFQTDHATIYTINGNLQATGDVPMNLNTEVQDTLTMDCYDTDGGSGDYDTLLGTTSNPGFVTAGTPAVAQSTCDVTTNDDQGYYLTVQDDNGAANTVLTHDDPNTTAVYEIQDLTQYTESTPNTINWNAPTTKGLGFSIIEFPDTTPSNNTLGTTWTETGNCPEGIAADSNDYAGIPDTPQAIAAVPEYSANQTTTQICYKVDVPTSQPSGIYTGSVTYTATSDASSYLN